MTFYLDGVNAGRPSLLTGTRKERRAEKKARKEEYLARFIASGMSRDAAKTYAKDMLKNDKAEERVARTVTYMTGKEAREMKKITAKGQKKFVKHLNEDQRIVVNNNQEDFFTDGKYDLNKSKQFVYGFTGGDYKLNDGSNLERPEDHTMANYLSTTDGVARGIAKKHGYDTENLFAKRALHVATFGLAGGTGGAIGGLGIAHSSKTTAKFVSDAVVDHNGNVIFDRIEDIVKIGAKTGVAVTAGSILGALGGLSGGLKTIDAVGGQGDLFNGRTPEHIIKTKNVKGLDESIKPLMIAVIADEVMTDEQKVQLIRECIGENSSSLCNEREFAQLYNKVLGNQQPEPTKEPVKPIKDDKENPFKLPKPKDLNFPPRPEKPEEQCPIEKFEKTTVEEKEVEVPLAEAYKPKKGEYWYSIVKAKYCLKDHDEITAAVTELKKLHGLSDAERKENIQPPVINLPETLNGHKYGGCGKIETTDQFADAKEYTGTYTPETRTETTTKTDYYFKDCKMVSNPYETAEKRDLAADKYEQERQEAKKAA